MPESPAAEGARGSPLGSTVRCSGTQTSRLMPPKIMAASRHPNALISTCPRGQNTVLAKPPNSVSTAIARRWLVTKARVSTAKAGSYSVPAIATPSSAQTT